MKRQSTRLLRIETEHGALVATPEHPFATWRSGWIRADRLAPGERVVSAKFGTTLILSVRSQTPESPVAVFNISVNASHAYLVGADDVLVHNTKCHGPLDPVTRSTQRIDAVQRELEGLQAERLTQPERAAELEQKITDAKHRLASLKHVRRTARWRLRQESTVAGAAPQRENPATPDPPQPQSSEESALARNTRELEAVDRDLQQIQRASPDNPAEAQKQLDELLQKRRRIKNRIAYLKSYDRKRRGEHVPLRQRQSERAHTEHEAAKQELAAVQTALQELAAQTPAPGPESPRFRARNAKLKKRLEQQQADYQSASQILIWEERIAEIERLQRAGGAPPDLQKEKAESRARVRKEKAKVAARKDGRRQPTDSEESELENESVPAPKRRRIERTRDILEQLEREREALRHEPASAARDQRAARLADAAQTLRKLIELRRKEGIVATLLARVHKARRALLARNEDTTQVDQKLAKYSRELAAHRDERDKLRAHALLLGLESARGRKPQGVDETRFRELERLIDEPDKIDKGRIAEIELEIAQTLEGDGQALDAEFFEEIWREADAETAEQEAARNEGEGVDAELLALTEALHTDPSSEREAAVEPGLRALQNELREERSALEAADFSLANEHAFTQQTLPPTSSNLYAEGARRLAQLQRQREALRSQWRERMARRIENARQALHSAQNRQGLRDPAAESDLARQIAVLESELQYPF